MSWRLIATAAILVARVSADLLSQTVFHTEAINLTTPFHWKSCSDDGHFLCGYITLPLDWTNISDVRTVDIATTMYQPKPGKKSARTLILEPGGPGGSGTGTVWVNAKKRSEMYTDGTMDVLGFDPRGVNLSSPGLSCFPHNSYRDRWEWTRSSWPETRGYHTVDEADAMNEAVMLGCKQNLGDFPRFVSTAFVCRDIDAIREALGEAKLTGFMVSYGTGIAQSVFSIILILCSLPYRPAYAQMFPHRVGRLVLDGLEFIEDGRKPWQWGLTSLDNVTNAFEDGFIGECVTAGPSKCKLVTGLPSLKHTQQSISHRLQLLLRSIRSRPVSGVSKFGPGIVTYERLVSWIYEYLYNPALWKGAAHALAELEAGNATLVLQELGRKGAWSFDPTEEHLTNVFPGHYHDENLATEELSQMVICADAYDAEHHELEWWKEIHAEMLNRSWISASPRFFSVLPCRHFSWTPAEVYRGGFDSRLETPLLLLGSPYDPATPLRNARRLLNAMGENARLVVHHGYGHSSGRDLSNCTIAKVRDFIMDGAVPDREETNCYANKRPFDTDYPSS